MNKFEHLFSQDPIGAFEKIERDYARYFAAAYKIDDEALDQERMDLLSKDNNMGKDPYIEILPEYSPAPNLSSMDDLVLRYADNKSFGSECLSRQFFEGLIAKGLMRGLMEKYLPYGHQIGMLEKAFSGIDEKGGLLKYKNTVITSGTGSGKTESFLLPLLADIFKEAQEEKWGPARDHTDWHLGVLEGRSTQRRYAPNQRAGDPRPAAIRALVLYPMNALVEDQMARLREALDSDEVRSFMQEKLNGNRIYFGSYNGKTIAPKNYDLLFDPAVTAKDRNKKRAEVAKRLGEIHNQFVFVNKYVSANPGKKDALYISPRLGGNLNTGEMITRWDMQCWAPDILITNTSMLSIMLMRRAEKGMFDDTRRWLAAEDLPLPQRDAAKKNRVFHIIVDELHLYRGTAGSEVGCLLRMLYDAIGLLPVIEDGNGNLIPNPQIKILASSASLGDEDSTQKFLEEFFGLYSTIADEKVFNIQGGANYFGINRGLTIDYTKFAFFTHTNFVALGNQLNEEEANVNRLFLCKSFLEKEFGVQSLVDFCHNYQEQLFWDFYNVLPQNSDGSRRPVYMPDLIEKLFKGNAEALKGFLIFRGFLDSQKGISHRLPRFRFHKFFKYIEGLWGELNPSLSNNERPIVNLSYTAEEVGKNNRKVLELLRCENCHKLFIGGNRRKDPRSGVVSFTLNYPNLDQIPSFNPTPMVQNKNYRDYAIFWPNDLNTNVELISGHLNQGASDHVVVIGSGNTNYDNGQAKWVPGYLDSVTGEFTPRENAITSTTGSLKDSIRERGIQGFLYRVVAHNTNTEIDESRSTRIYAAPCTCPSCLQDFTRRKFTNSPIRSFRTGIDRSTQILSKELLYQLDENSAKLIGFSDSREDAAKQALGIEKEQYRDMVRMLFVDCVNEVGINDIVEFIKGSLQEGRRKKDIREEVRSRWPRPDINTIIIDIFDAIEENDYSELSRYNQDNAPLSILIGNGFDGVLVRKLLERGINPAGEAYKYQWYYRDNTNGVFHWSTAYDFSSFQLVSNPHFRDNTYAVQIRKQLENAVFANSFGKYMGVSVLDAGIGYICGPHHDSIKESREYKKLREVLPSHIDVFEFVDAYIRVLGDNYFYPNNEHLNNAGGNVATDYASLNGALRKPIKKICQDYHTCEAEILGDRLVQYLRVHCTDPVLSLELDKLFFAKMTKDRYLKCPKCGRVHPNMGFGFCTNTSCMKELDPGETVIVEELHKHYISFDILKEKKTPRRLHTEELSGQTDDIQSRLREFKDLILVDKMDPEKLGLEKTLPIDMLCVTTTMEVGVDIGSLQAVFQGNMPPTRYNYQQRVGRVGRRGQAFSTAFTFCRGRSHDVYYYDKATDEMVGGIPATPTLSLAPYRETDGSLKMKQAIMKRVVVKEVLHKAFLNLHYRYDLRDTAGEFGFVYEWDNNKTILENWIRNNSQTIEDIVHRYFDQFNGKGQIGDDIDLVIDWIENNMVDQIDYAVSKTTYLGTGLAQYLSESGFLPMYGLPSDSRSFYHGFNFAFGKVKSVDRSSEMAITEFAPGSEKTKDKGRYRVEGLTIPIKEDVDDNGQINFYDPAGDALSDRYVLTFFKNIGESDNGIKEVSEAPFDTPVEQIVLSPNQKLLVVPQAYRSLDIRNNTGTPVENNDRGSSFSQSLVFAGDNGSQAGTLNKKSIRNVDISAYELGLNEDPTVWHININNNRFYTGSYGVHVDPPYGELANFMFFSRRNNNGRTDVAPVEQGIGIALGSKKVTEMIKIELKHYPDTLNLSLRTGNKSAIRAAFFSAAFLLQRALADKLDVQPDEIEICEKIDDSHEYPSIYLSDALPNGAGIVSYLYEEGRLEELIRRIVSFDSFDPIKTTKEESFMQSLISNEHRRNCLTACQRCLMTYANRGYHHILDWRLGVGLLRLMIDETYDFGFDKEKRHRYDEFADWDSIVSACANKCHLDLNRAKFGYWINDGMCTVIYHPLWKKEIVYGAINEPYSSLRMFNTFKLLRSELSEDRDEQVSALTRSGEQIISRIKRKKSSPTNTPQPSASDGSDDIIL